MKKMTVLALSALSLLSMPLFANNEEDKKEPADSLETTAIENFVSISSSSNDDDETRARQTLNDDEEKEES